MDANFETHDAGRLAQKGALALVRLDQVDMATGGGRQHQPGETRPAAEIDDARRIWRQMTDELQ